MNGQAALTSGAGSAPGTPIWIHRTFTKDHLPPGLAGRTIAFATDIHVNRLWKDESLRRLIGRIGEASPDLVLWGGDYAESAEHAKRFFDAASELRPPLGMFGVIGNNDYESFEGRMDELIKGMKRARIFPLINKSSAQDLGGGRLIVSGSDEPKYGFPSSRMLRGQVQKDDFRILLCHSPQAVDAAVEGIEKKPDLVFCGHTHGGQFAFVGLSIYSLGYERKRHKESRYFFVRGERELDGMRIFVSNGIGTSLLPFRVGARPELHLIRLERK